VIGKRAEPLLSLLRQRIERGQARGTLRNDVPASSLVSMNLSAICYRFIMAEPLTDAMQLAGTPIGDDADREHVIRFVLSTLKA
jgi:hypothetical protein